MNLLTQSPTPDPAPIDPGGEGPKDSHEILKEVRAQIKLGAIQAERLQGRDKAAPKASLAVYAEPTLEELSGAKLVRRERTALAIAESHDLSAVTARVLAHRGFKNDETLDAFLAPKLAEFTATLGDLKGLRAATKLITGAIKANESISLICDYDADGTTSAAILSRFLRSLGATVHVLSPDRNREGHGLNVARVEEAAARGSGLVIALDFGTKSHTELTKARALGMKTVVIDHHHKPEGPELPVDALINPRQDGCGFTHEDVCSAGLTWLVASHLRTHLMHGSDPLLRERAKRSNVRSLLPLAALGTIADVVELTPCNRAIVAAGLGELDRTKIKGLQALKDLAGITGAATAEDLGFGLGPRLNALSRMLRTTEGKKTAGQVMVELLTTPSRKRGYELAELADTKNKERKELENLVAKKIIEKVEASGALPPVLFVSEHEFNGAIQGIIAARLVERYNRPAFVMRADDAGLLVGSARGVPGVHLAKILEKTKHLIERGGGHPGAAGFSIRAENLPAFEKAVTRLVNASLKGGEAKRIELADVAVTVRELNAAGPHLMDEFKLIEPFGRGNPAPKLFVDRLTVASIERLDNKHLKVWFRQGDDYIYGFLWRNRSHPALSVGAVVDVVAKPFLETRNADHNREKQTIKLELLAVKTTPPS